MTHFIKGESTMEYRILAIGDVVGGNGLAHLEQTLRPFQEQEDIRFTVVNGENIDGVGLYPNQDRKSVV